MDSKNNQQPKLLAVYKGTEKPDNPIMVDRWFNPFVRVSLFGDLLARTMPGLTKLKWAVILIFWPFGTSAYYYGVYASKPENGYKSARMEKGASTNRLLNDLLFYFLLLILILAFLGAAIAGIYYLSSQA